MIKEAIASLVRGNDLTLEEAAMVMEDIMDGKATPAQLGAFLCSLSVKGETSDEIAGMARVMRDKAVQVKTNGPVLDIVGTGGDGLNTFNISTAAAFVAAGAGLKVAKHGNRAASSRCGAADVLEKLGVKISLNAEQVQACVQEVGIGFMFAPNFHPAMKYAAGPRKEIGIRTVFNILGPLTNPAHADYQVVGVHDKRLAETICAALMRLNLKHAMVVHGRIGMDEISITGTSLLWEIKNGALTGRRHEIHPRDMELSQAPLESIKGGTPEENAEIIKRVFSGEKGPRRDVVVMNAAAALFIGEKVENLKQGAILAQNIIDQGMAMSKLEHLIKFTQNLI